MFISDQQDETKELMVFNKDALEIITSTPLFNESEKNELVGLSQSMEKSFYNSQMFRTDTEVRYSVLNDTKFPTPASKYYQSLREMNVHQCELISLLYTYESKKEDMKIFKADIMELEDKIRNATENGSPEYVLIKLTSKLKKKEIDLERSAFFLKNMKREADGRKLELVQWDAIIKELEPSLIEMGIPLDDPDAHQSISYSIRFVRQILAVIQAKSESSPAETINLVSQLQSFLKSAAEKGHLQAVRYYLTPVERTFIEMNAVSLQLENIKELLIDSKEPDLLTD